MIGRRRLENPAWRIDHPLGRKYVGRHCGTDHAVSVQEGVRDAADRVAYILTTRH